MKKNFNPRSNFLLKQLLGCFISNVGPKKYIENCHFSLVFDKNFFSSGVRVYAEYDPIDLFENKSCLRVNTQTFSKNYGYNVDVFGYRSRVLTKFSILQGFSSWGIDYAHFRGMKNFSELI